MLKHTIEKQDYVVTGARLNNKPVAHKEHQAVKYNHTKRIITHVMSPSPNSASMMNGSQIKYIIDNDSMRSIESVVLRFQIRADGGDMVLAPTPYFFSRIEFYNRHTGEEISRLYADALYTMLHLVSSDHSEQWQDLVNMDAETNQVSQRIHKSGTTRYYYLPLVGSFFEDMDLDLSTISTDIEIRLHPVSPTTGFPTGTPALLEVAGLYEIAGVDQSSHKAHRNFLARHVPAHNFIDVQQYSIPAQTMNGSTLYSFDLDQFKHTSAALLCVIRATGATNGGNDLQNYIDLYDGEIDIVSASGASQYGGGRAVPADYIRNVIAPKYVESKLFKNCAIYPIIFGDLQRAFSGTADGYHVFKGEKQRLEITTPAVGTSCVLTATASALPDAGWIFISYKGHVNKIDFNASASLVGGAANSPTIHRDGLRVTTIGQFSTGPVTFTISRDRDQPIELPNILTDFRVWAVATNTGSPITYDLVETTAGVNGWFNGVYDVDIYSLYFKTITQNGKELMSIDMK